MINYPPKSLDDNLGFGRKYPDEPLWWIIENDPDYIKWLIEEADLDFVLDDEAWQHLQNQ